MKKLFYTLVILGGILSLSSCAKECDCTTMMNGEVISHDIMTLQDGQSCSDFSKGTNLYGLSSSVICTPQLF
ncbi:MAG: hypothetical protein IKG90_05915 [Bacteroidales bacterium]|nr:hypothetical protein [Bacteroidales bacterium]